MFAISFVKLATTHAPIAQAQRTSAPRVLQILIYPTSMMKLALKSVL